MRSISTRKHEMDIWLYGSNFCWKHDRFSESLKLRSFQTTKPRNNKPRNQETKHQETNKQKNKKTRYQQPRNRRPRYQKTKDQGANTLLFSKKGIPSTPQVPTPTPAPWLLGTFFKVRSEQNKLCRVAYILAQVGLVQRRRCHGTFYTLPSSGLAFGVSCTNQH